jgi:hypothetical protein
MEALHFFFLAGWQVVVGAQSAVIEPAQQFSVRKPSKSFICG